MYIYMYIPIPWVYNSQIYSGVQGSKAARAPKELARASKYFPRLPQLRHLGLVRLNQGLTGS